MSWFNCKITYEKEVNQSGKMRKVSESYLVDAESFADAEFRLAEFLQGRGAFITESVRKMRLYELFLDHKSEWYYKIKVGFVSLDEKSGMERKKYVQMIVQADDLDEALEKFHESMKDTLSDYEVASISETPIVDVLPFKM